MEDKSGDIQFPAAGDYPLKLQFNQLTADAGCILNWQPPGEEKLSVIRAANLIHAKASENIAWNKADWELFTTNHPAYVKKYGRKYEKMDYGPFLSGTFDAPSPKDNTTLKGIIVDTGRGGGPDLGPYILFDTELMRYSAGWTGDMIDFHGVAFTGEHGRTPTIAGPQFFGTAVMPGWGHDGSFNDPRSKPFGPLPRDQAHFRGLYRYANETILSYTINGVGVLDMPSSLVDGTNFKPLCIVRILHVDPSKEPLKLVVADEGPVIDASEGVELTKSGHQIIAIHSSARSGA